MRKLSYLFMVLSLLCFAAPAFALRLALGEMADQLLLSSQRVQPAQLSRLGYKFVYPELQSALAEVLREN